MQVTARLPLLLLGSLMLGLAAGCSTPVHVTSTPPGAQVYATGVGRPAYTWKHMGQTPVTFNSPYNKIQTRVRWSNNTFSPAQETSLLNQSEVSVNFTQTPTTR